MNAVRLKIRRTGSISPETPGGSFLRNRRSARARIDAGASYPARIRRRAARRNIPPPPPPFSLSLFLSFSAPAGGFRARAERRNRVAGLAEHVALRLRVHIMQVHRRAAVLHLRGAFKTRRVLAFAAGSLFYGRLRSARLRPP